MPINFNGTGGQSITMAAGGTILAAPFTAVVIMRRLDPMQYHDVLVTHDSGGTYKGFDVGINQNSIGNHMYVYSANGVGVENGPVVANGSGWKMLGWSKASGTVAPRYHTYDYATKAFQHVNDSSTLVNGTNPGAGGFVKIGRFESDTAGTLSGDMEVAAIWDRVLTDAEIESLPWEFMNWLMTPSASIPTPIGLWLLDQESTSHKVIDWTGKGANEASRVGTSISAQSVPMFSKYDDIWLPSFSAPGGGGTTQFGSSTLGITAGIASTGVRTRLGTSTLGITAGVASTGFKKTFGVSTLGITDSIVSTGIRKALGASTLGIATNIASTGLRKAFGVSTLAVTVGVVSTGLRTTRASSTLGITTGIGSTGFATKFGRSTVPINLGIQTVGFKTTYGTSTLPVQFDVSTGSGTKLYGTSTLGLSAAIQSSGTRTGHGSSSLPVTASITTTSTRTGFGKSQLGLTLDIGAVAFSLRRGVSTLPLLVSIQSAGHKAGSNIFPDGNEQGSIHSTKLSAPRVDAAMQTPTVDAMPMEKPKLFRAK